MDNFKSSEYINTIYVLHVTKFQVQSHFLLETWSAMWMQGDKVHHMHTNIA